MKTDYKNINSFEVAVVSMIVTGFLVIGAVIFMSLTPRQQGNVSSALEIFDIHQQVDVTVSNIGRGAMFVLDGQQEFYNQFYLAFNEIATVPEGALEIPLKLVSNVRDGVNIFSDQVASGYNQPNPVQAQIAEATSVAYEVYEGRVLGNSITKTFNFSTPGCADYEKKESLNFRYEYRPPDLESIKLSLNKFLNQ